MTPAPGILGMAKYLCRLALPALLFPLLACGYFRPALHAAYATNIPKPNGLAEKYPWAETPALTVLARRGAGDFAETRPVEIKAVHDDRIISFFIRWADERESLVGRYWIWDEPGRAYFLQQFAIDRCAILFPLSPHADFKPWRGRSAVYDVWQWRAGWSELSGYAADRRLIVRPHPAGTSPAQLKGGLYPLTRRRMVELEWVDDAGVPGTLPLPKPVTYLKNRLTGIEAAESPHGSVIDVLAQGVYTPRLRSTTHRQEAWRFYSTGDDWFVEFYRMLVTPTKDEGDDYPLRGRGPHPFAIALWDNDASDNAYLTDPIRLYLDEPK